MYVDTTSNFYTNALGSTATTVYNFENDSGLCSNAMLNENPSDSCYPPSNDSCCDSFCKRQQFTCLQPAITSIVGIPFAVNGALITVLGTYSFSFVVHALANIFQGNNFGDNYFDTVISFNDTLCLIHERSETVIVCWVTGDTFAPSGTQIVCI